MHVRTSCSIILSTVLLSSALGALPAQAAAPGNDLKVGSVDIPSLPFDATVDTTEATTDADDAALNAQCGAPVTDHSVWYTYTPSPEVTGLVIDVAQSDYLAGVIVAESDGAGGLIVVACGPDAVGLPVNVGTTYTILAFGDTPGQGGGTLRLHAEEAVVPTLDATVNPTGRVDKAGNALISGTYTCTGGQFVDLSTSLAQNVGRFTIRGSGFAFDNGTCDGLPHTWSAVIVPDNGKFAGGKSVAVTFGFSCNAFTCAESYSEQVVRLSKSTK